MIARVRLTAMVRYKAQMYHSTDPAPQRSSPCRSLSHNRLYFFLRRMRSRCLMLRSMVVVSWLGLGSASPTQHANATVDLPGISSVGIGLLQYAPPELRRRLFGSSEEHDSLSKRACPGQLLCYGTTNVCCPYDDTCCTVDVCCKPGYACYNDGHCYKDTV